MRERAELALLRHAPAVTLDGIAIKLEANIELPEEAVAAMEAGADGIGLFRSEFLFMSRPDLPSGEEQNQAYATVVKTMADRPVPITKQTRTEERRRGQELVRQVRYRWQQDN